MAEKLNRRQLITASVVGLAVAGNIGFFAYRFWPTKKYRYLVSGPFTDKRKKFEAPVQAGDPIEFSRVRVRRDETLVRVSLEFYRTGRVGVPYAADIRLLDQNGDEIKSRTVPIADGRLRKSETERVSHVNHEAISIRDVPQTNIVQVEIVFKRDRVL